MDIDPRVFELHEELKLATRLAAVHGDITQRDAYASIVEELESLIPTDHSECNYASAATIALALNQLARSFEVKSPERISFATRSVDYCRRAVELRPIPQSMRLLAKALEMSSDRHTSADIHGLRESARIWERVLQETPDDPQAYARLYMTLDLLRVALVSAGRKDDESIAIKQEIDLVSVWAARPEIDVVHSRHILRVIKVALQAANAHDKMGASKGSNITSEAVVRPVEGLTERMRTGLLDEPLIWSPVARQFVHLIVPLCQAGLGAVALGAVDALLESSDAAGVDMVDPILGIFLYSKRADILKHMDRFGQAEAELILLTDLGLLLVENNIENDSLRTIVLANIGKLGMAYANSGRVDEGRGVLLRGLDALESAPRRQGGQASDELWGGAAAILSGLLVVEDFDGKRRLSKALDKRLAALCRQRRKVLMAHGRSPGEDRALVEIESLLNLRKGSIRGTLDGAT